MRRLTPGSHPAARSRRLSFSSRRAISALTSSICSSHHARSAAADSRSAGDAPPPVLPRPGQLGFLDPQRPRAKSASAAGATFPSSNPCSISSALTPVMLLATRASLNVRALQRLLQFVLHLHDPFHIPVPMPHQFAQFRVGGGPARNSGAAVRAAAGRQPFGITHVGLPAGHSLEMLRVDQQQRERFFQQIPHGLPVSPRWIPSPRASLGGFEANPQAQQLGGERAERFLVLFAPLRPKPSATPSPRHCPDAHPDQAQHA